MPLRLTDRLQELLNHPKHARHRLNQPRRCSRKIRDVHEFFLNLRGTLPEVQETLANGQEKVAIDEEKFSTDDDIFMTRREKFANGGKDFLKVREVFVTFAIFSRRSETSAAHAESFSAPRKLLICLVELLDRAATSPRMAFAGVSSRQQVGTLSNDGRPRLYHAESHSSHGAAANRMTV